MAGSIITFGPRTDGHTDGHTIFSAVGSTEVENCNVLEGLVSTSETSKTFRLVRFLDFLDLEDFLTLPRLHDFLDFFDYFDLRLNFVIFH